MIKQYGLHKCLQFGLASLLGWFIVSMFTAKAQAQQSNIVPDNTLGAESSKVIGNFQGQPIEVITGGATRQINLFHSFQEFNISEGRAAYFSSPSADIQNIFARVTGSNPSKILGTLGTLSNSSPNLFLINPNGIVFGKNARLNLQGSFVGTTANGIQFGNQGIFSATNPQAVPLLTINPSVLLFNQIQANGGIINQSQARAGTNLIGNNVTGLRVADAKSLLLVGGNINIDGGGIRAYGGNIELAGLAAPGNVRLNIAGDNLSLVIPDNVERADVSLSNGAEVNVRGAGGGNIKIQARNVNLAEGSILRAGIDTGLGTPNSKGGDITINATGDTTLTDESLIANVVQSKAFGNAGDINITTGTLTLSNTGQINANLFGQGNAGNVNINAQGDISFRTSKPGEANGIFARVIEGAIGNGGNVTINTSSLEINDGSEIQGSTLGKGNSGNIIINARNNISLDGNNGNIFSRIINDVQPTAEGNAGNIQITTGTLNVTNGAFISSSVSGKGNGGNISINALDNIAFDSTSIASTIVFDQGVGNGGNIYLKTGSLSLTNGGQISTSVSGQGNAGNITVEASDNVKLDNLDYIGFSGLQSDLNIGGVGKGGNIQVTTGSLSITNGAGISSFTAGVANAGNITINARDNVTFSGFGGREKLGSRVSTEGVKNGIGNGGDIHITASNLLLKDGGQLRAINGGQGNGGNIFLDVGNTITFDGIGDNGLSSGADTQAFNGNGGSIQIKTGSLFLTNGGMISSSLIEGKGKGKAGDININSASTTLDNQAAIAAITNSGDGGNINLTADDLLLLRHGSGISTTAGTAQSGGNGGNIDINSRFIVAIPKENSDITANAFTGTGGNVKINSQGIFGIEKRPKPTEKSDITASSELGVAGTISINAPDTSSIQNSFAELFPVIDTNALIAQSCISRGNKRQENSFMITGSGALTPNRPGEGLVSTYTTGEVRGVETTSRPWKKGDPIIEAQGLYRLDNGQLLLSRECSS